jgi:hypothetical protein
VVSDGKSALMTEKLDEQMKGPFDNQQTGQVAADAQNKMTGEKDKWKPYQHGDKWYISPHQGGFDFNYDVSIPKIAEELTGSKGEKVSLGEHKNAFEEQVNTPQGNQIQARSPGGALMAIDPRK